MGRKARGKGALAADAAEFVVLDRRLNAPLSTPEGAIGEVGPDVAGLL